MRAGFLGGTFDPIHNAHLRIAEAAAEQCGLERIYLAAAESPPHRAQGTFASWADRLRMVELACEGRPLLTPSALDHGPKSYSILAVERLRSLLNDTDEICFLIGADAFAELRSWHRWRELAELVTFAVIDRPGAAYAAVEGVRTQRVTGLRLPISSSEIRAQLARGDPNVPVPPAVLNYIREHHLYGLPAG